MCRKHQAMTKANANENKGHIPHKCKVGDEVFVSHDKTSCMRPRKLSDPRKWLCWIIKVFKHGNAVMNNQNGTKETFSITHVKPHFRHNTNMFKSRHDNKDANKTTCR